MSELNAFPMPKDPSACFSPTFVAQFEVAVLALPSDHQRITWANSEKGRVAAVVGPAKGSFVVGLEEGLVMVFDTLAREKMGFWPVADTTGLMVVALMQDVLGKRNAQTT